jgi:hypothetical protein
MALPSVWRENYSALKKRGLGSVKSFLLATAPGFTHRSLQAGEPRKLAEDFARETDEALKRFKGPAGQYFWAKPTREEFAKYLILEKRLPPAEAYYQAILHQNASKYYRKEPEAAGSFALRNWALWKARNISKLLFARGYSREHAAGEERQRIFEEDIAHAIAEGIRVTGEPGKIKLKVIWGGHKESDEGTADAKDEQVLNRIKEFAGAIEKEGVKVDVGLLFADIHSEKINRVEPERIQKYYDSISKLAGKVSFSVDKLSDVWRERNPFNVPGWEEKEEVKGIIGRTAKAIETLDKLGLIAKGAERAEKHSMEAIAGEAKPEEVSEVYHTFQAVEKHMLEKIRSPGVLYVSFEDPRRAQEYKPEHTLFFWSFKRGTGETPWFGRRKTQA